MHITIELHLIQKTLKSCNSLKISLLWTTWKEENKFRFRKHGKNTHHYYPSSHHKKEAIVATICDSTTIHLNVLFCNGNTKGPLLMPAFLTFLGLILNIKPSFILETWIAPFGAYKMIFFCKLVVFMQQPKLSRILIKEEAMTLIFKSRCDL